MKLKFFISLQIRNKNISMKKNYLAFAGIGIENFFLCKARCEAKKTISFPDHYIFKTRIDRFM